MKKLLVFSFLAALCLPSMSYGQNRPERGFYLAVGGSWALEELDLGTETVNGIKFDTSFDDAWGVKNRLGYHYNEWVAFEADLDFFSDFESEDKVMVSGNRVRTEVDIRVITLMAGLKLSGRFRNVEPFVVLGGGMMNAKAHFKARDGVFESESNSETDYCYRFGAGLDVYPKENASVFFEMARVWGWSDLDDIQYSQLTLGVSYHF
jgi:opacity protein-like surface antigen